MESAPLFDDIAEGRDGGAAHWVRTRDGLRLRLAHYKAPDARGTVLMFPGRTEYVEKYAPAAEQFAADGLCTMVIDWRGQGLSDRILGDPMGGHVNRFRDYQLDVAAMLEATEALDLPRPWHLLAHSMGGAIGLRTLVDGAPVASAAFSAPMWGIQIAPALRPVAWSFSWLARQAGLDAAYAPGTSGSAYPAAAAFAENLLTGDADQFALMARQVAVHPELALGGPSLRWLNEALRECRLLSRAPSPDIPCLTLLGSEERIVDTLRVRRRMGRWPEGELVVLDGARHEPLMERPEIRERAFAAFRAHFRRHG